MALASRNDLHQRGIEQRQRLAGSFYRCAALEGFGLLIAQRLAGGEQPVVYFNVRKFVRQCLNP